MSLDDKIDFSKRTLLRISVVQPTETSDSHFKTVVFEYSNASSMTHIMSKADYEHLIQTEMFKRYGAKQ